MKTSLFKKLIAVTLAFATLMFVGCQKDEPVNEENPSENISQESQIDDSSIVEKISVMDNTIDLHSIELNMESSITGDYEVSVPYPTSLGTVYLVSEHLTEKTLTYLFVATQDDFMYEMVTDMGFGLDGYEIYTANVDNEAGEEIVLAMPLGGTAGRGLWITSVFKITDKGIKEMNFAENGYKVTAEKPFKYVIKNAFADSVETVDADREYAYDFEEDGTPVEGASENIYSLPWYIRPVDVDDDGVSEIIVREWSNISKETNNKVVDLEATYKYDSEKDEFVVVETYTWIKDDDWEYDIDYNCCQYLDIDGDGDDEFITNNCIDKDNVTCNVYTFEDGKMIHAGEIPCTNRSFFHYKDGKITESVLIEGTISYNTYMLVDNKLVHDDRGGGIPMENEDVFYESIGTELEWEFY